MFVVLCAPVGREAIARLRSRTVADGRAVDGNFPARVGTGRGAGVSSLKSVPHTHRQGNTMGKAPRRYRPRKVVARSSFARAGDASPTITPSGFAKAPEPRRFVSYTPESSQSAERRFTDVQELRAGLHALTQLARERDDARRLVLGHEEQIRSAVAHLRVDGASWAQIGAALGVSRQGARQRFDPAARAAHRSRQFHARSTGLADDATPAAARRTPAGDEQEDERWTSWRP